MEYQFQKGLKKLSDKPVYLHHNLRNIQITFYLQNNKTSYCRPTWEEKNIFELKMFAQIEIHVSSCKKMFTQI